LVEVGGSDHDDVVRVGGQVAAGICDVSYELVLFIASFQIRIAWSSTTNHVV
jgi:hypothetical protein